MAGQPKRTIDPTFLAGEIHALITFAQVLASVHPLRARLLAEFEVAEQVGLARVEMVPVDDKLVRGYQFATGLIRKALETPVEY